jgi:hypothetical protein
MAPAAPPIIRSTVPSNVSRAQPIVIASPLWTPQQLVASRSQLGPNVPSGPGGIKRRLAESMQIPSPPKKAKEDVAVLPPDDVPPPPPAERSKPMPPPVVLQQRPKKPPSLFVPKKVSFTPVVLIVRY